ncbi:MAG TPA: class I SAM-dependent methyltransferase [Candidatus Paceibacterota bacterium]|jgi:cyclopropane-fatty-acyl-phospholipid synthase|nr:class I SAM-dependent methyltransferase [Candidatus Paceibacterota bacterium]
MFATRVTRLFAEADIVIGGDRPWDIRIKEGFERRFFTRVVLLNSLGLGKSFMEGIIKCDDIYGMLRRLMGMLHKWSIKRASRFRDHLPSSLPEAWIKFQIHGLRKDTQSIAASAASIGAHYDNGNAFYRLVLGPTETYSCAFFFDTEDLDVAQKIKYRHTFSKLELNPEAKELQVLEIGCGWGWGAAYLAKLYPNVTFDCITLSREQYERALEAHKELIAAGRLKFYLMDYREIPEHPEYFGENFFDGVYSIGMFEHVGQAHYREYAAIVAWCTKPGALRAALDHRQWRHRSVHLVQDFPRRDPADEDPGVEDVRAATDLRAFRESRDALREDYSCLAHESDSSVAAAARDGLLGGVPSHVPVLFRVM